MGVKTRKQVTKLKLTMC